MILMCYKNVKMQMELAIMYNYIVLLAHYIS